VVQRRKDYDKERWEDEFGRQAQEQRARQGGSSSLSKGLHGMKQGAGWQARRLLFLQLAEEELIN
jgi:hypothetical protein